MTSSYNKGVQKFFSKEGEDGRADRGENQGNDKEELDLALREPIKKFDEVMDKMATKAEERVREIVREELVRTLENLEKVFNTLAKGYARASGKSP